MNIHSKDPKYLANKTYYEKNIHQMKLTSLFIKYLIKKYMANLSINKNKKEKKSKNKDEEIKSEKKPEKIEKEQKEEMFGKKNENLLINFLNNDNNLLKNEQKEKEIHEALRPIPQYKNQQLNNNIFNFDNLINNIFIKNLVENNYYNLNNNSINITNNNYNFNNKNFLNNNFIINNYNYNFNNYNYYLNNLRNDITPINCNRNNYYSGINTQNDLINANASFPTMNFNIPKEELNQKNFLNKPNNDINSSINYSQATNYMSSLYFNNLNNIINNNKNYYL